MNIEYPISEILKCVEIINQPKKKFDRNSDKTFNLNNTVSIKKKITQTQGTFGETIETEELIEETFDNAKPFEIDEITKINDLGMKKNKKNKKESKALLLTTEVANQSSRQKMNKKYIDVLEEELKLMTKITTENKDQLEKYKNFNLSLNEQVVKLKERNAQLENDFNKVSKELNQQTPDKEFQTKLDVIYKQQNIIKDYQDQISKLKEENQLLEQNSEKTIHQEDHKDEMEDIARKIKYYQDDNLRLSNELVKLSNKLENTKSQLEYFENNKAKLMSQLENLNNIVSESNVIGSPFDTTISKVNDKSEVDKKIPNLYLALSVDNNDNFIADEITKITNIRLKEILDKHSYIILNQGKIHPYSMEEVSSIDEQVKLIAKQFPDSLLLLLSLTGNIMKNSGDMFPSITILYMSFSAYSPEGQIIWKKTYEAKRLNTKKVSKLNTSEKKRSFIKTLEKGFNEIKKKRYCSNIHSCRRMGTRKSFKLAIR